MPRKRRQGLPTNPGRSPGTLVIPEAAPPSRVRVTRYGRQHYDVRDNLTPAEIAELRLGDEIVWIEVEGYGTRDMIAAIEQRFDVPRLALEDVLGNASRPKLDQFGDALFVVARGSRSFTRGEFEQVSIFWRQRLVITFVDEPLEILTPLRQRLSDSSSLTRHSQADFLVYRLIDTVVDTYVPCLDQLGTRLDEVEAEAIEHPSSKPLRTLYELMRDLRQLARIALPMRELASALGNEARGFFQPSTLPFLADLRDHTQALVELTSHYRDLGTDVRELIHGALNLRMNQVMRLLTAVTSIFIPLSFVTGLYGMNFDHMPETEWRYGYFVVLGLLGAVAFAIYRWLRRQGWTRVGDE